MDFYITKWSFMQQNGFLYHKMEFFISQNGVFYTAKWSFYITKWSFISQNGVLYNKMEFFYNKMEFYTTKWISI